MRYPSHAEEQARASETPTPSMQHYVPRDHKEPAARSSSFITSVQVLPKSTGAGYEVLSTSGRSRSGSSSSSARLLDNGANGVLTRESSVSQTPSADVTRSRSIGPRPPSHSSPKTSDSTQFSRNISNPVMLKKRQDKLLDATARSEWFKSASVVQETLGQRPAMFLPKSDSAGISSAHTPPSLPSSHSSASLTSQHVKTGNPSNAVTSELTSSVHLESTAEVASFRPVYKPGQRLKDSSLFFSPSLTPSPSTSVPTQPVSRVWSTPTASSIYTHPQTLDAKTSPPSGADASLQNPPQRSSFHESLRLQPRPVAPPIATDAAASHDQVSPLQRQLSFHHSLELPPSRMPTAPPAVPTHDPSDAVTHAPPVGTKIERLRNFFKRTRSPKKKSSPSSLSSSFPGPFRKRSGQLEQQQQQQQQDRTRKKSEAVKAHECKAGNAGLECSCEHYHCHHIAGEHVNNHLLALKDRRHELVMTSMKLEDAHKVDSMDDPRNIFWYPSLSFHPYRHGDPLVVFASLWPSRRQLQEHLQNSGIQQTVMKDQAVLDLCTLAVTCGPLHLLQCLIELQLIRVDQLTTCGSGLLHLAAVAQNVESVQYLMAAKVSSKLRDRQGLTADQVCYHSGIRKQIMSPRYALSRDNSKDIVQLQPSLQDKDTIFRLATRPGDFVDIQKKLQSLDFNVNTECDNNGDFLLHIAVRQGLAELPLLMALVKIQGADIELCNVDGMTPLMLTATAGNCVLCDVLICLFGADPNKSNSQTGQTALHYAVEGNHRKTVECLIRRGADVNAEDHDGLRPDDIPSCVSITDDCREIITFNRIRRLEMLSDLVRKGEVVYSQLLPSDLYVVDSDGHTLIMIAAINNRFQTLHNLLDVSCQTVNAQHSKTGMTALAMAAQMGCVDSVSVLLRHKACCTIADMDGYLPLHHAILNNQEHVVDIFLDHFPRTYEGLYKAIRLSKKTSIHNKLKTAFAMRQDEIVTPKMLGCALNGDAEELFLLLDEGDHINPKSGTGNWPLYLAVENGHLEVLKLLCEKGGDIFKHHPTTGATVLHVASKMGHQTIVSYLMQYCPAPVQEVPSGTMSEGNHPASRHSRLLDADGEVIESSKSYKKRLDINSMDKDNKTALQLAAERGFSRIVELLLHHGATSAMLDAEGHLVTCPQYEGVRIMIESHRQEHTHQVIGCILDKSKKALSKLQRIWLARFDHHLRTKAGSTPLMIAANTGRLPILHFLLESAVYSEVEQYESDNCDMDSDTDSGVLDPANGSAKENGIKAFDEFHSTHDALPGVFLSSERIPDNRPDLLQFSLDKRVPMDSPELFQQRRLHRIVSDANRSKGLTIYHNGLISHVCAVNLLDGTTALHHGLEGGDAPQVLALLLDSDAAALNMQDDKGETVLHLACRLARKKSLELLLARPDIDLNVRTLEGCLPEELTSHKSIHRMVAKARSLMPAMPKQVSPAIEISIGDQSDRSPSVTGSTVNFDKVHSRYVALKEDVEKVS